jgi:hypothetical protein
MIQQLSRSEITFENCYRLMRAARAALPQQKNNFAFMPEDARRLENLVEQGFKETLEITKEPKLMWIPKRMHPVTPTVEGVPVEAAS